MAAPPAASISSKSAMWQDAASLCAFWQQDCTLPVMVLVWCLFSLVLMNNDDGR
jgi:hypothetical protein